MQSQRGMVGGTCAPKFFNEKSYFFDKKIQAENVEISHQFANLETLKRQPFSKERRTHYPLDTFPGRQNSNIHVSLPHPPPNWLVWLQGHFQQGQKPQFRKPPNLHCAGTQPILAYRYVHSGKISSNNCSYTCHSFSKFDAPNVVRDNALSRKR